jgi:CTP:molybdopterin cytidylyltransferase MocA
MNVAGVLLAAGRSSRAGGCKALALFEGRSLAARAADTLRVGGCSPIVVVVAAPYAYAVAGQLSPEVQLVENPEPERGMLSSLQLGVRATSAEAVVFSLVDHPFVRPQTVAALIADWRREGGVVVRPSFGQSSGHPVLIARAALSAVCGASLERTTREVLSAYDARDIFVTDAGVLDDFDTRDELVAAGMHLAGDDAADPIE